jgi:heat shock protein HtpX
VEGPVSALFIVPAISGSSIMNLFSTHPTLEARIEALKNIEREMEA